MSDALPAITWRGRIVAFLIGLALLTGVSEALLRIAMPNWRDFYSGRFMTRTVVPGHGLVTIGRAGFKGYFAQNNGAFRIHLAFNAQGLRNDEPIEAAHGRSWIVGDSMSFGWGVEAPEIYSAVAGRLAGVPTYNVASPGTDVCGYQALLARMPNSIRPSSVVVGLVLENDVHPYDCPAKARAQEQAEIPGERSHDRSLQGLKSFLTQNMALYNFFAVSLKRVDVFNRLLTDAGLLLPPHVPLHGVDPSTIAVLATRTADELQRLKDRLAPGTPFAVLVMPTRFEVRDSDPVHSTLRLSVMSALAARQIEVIDLAAGFTSAGFADTHFQHDGHWNVRGHYIAGEAVADWLRRTAQSR